MFSIYVKTEAISVCPLFYFLGRKVFKGIISTGTKEQVSRGLDQTLEMDFVIEAVQSALSQGNPIILNRDHAVILLALNILIYKNRIKSIM
ncbi:hypothetical protein D1839_16715 [Roseburia sp. 1XD42-34]|nr:hypothetical protein [Roseburia sp. 1XD42-34]RKI75280.1 hypothetical protein D7V87_16800 [Clostridium sp. 1xD42-85]